MTRMKYGLVDLFPVIVSSMFTFELPGGDGEIAGGFDPAGTNLIWCLPVLELSRCLVG